MHAHHIQVFPSCGPHCDVGLFSLCIFPLFSSFLLLLCAPFFFCPPSRTFLLACFLPSSWSHHLICRQAPRLHPCCKPAVPPITTKKWSIIWWASAKVGNVPLCCCFFGNHSALCMNLDLVHIFVPAVMPMKHAPKGQHHARPDTGQCTSHCACCSGGVVLNQASYDAGQLRHACSIGCSFHPLSYSLSYPYPLLALFHALFSTLYAWLPCVSVLPYVFDARSIS